MVVVAIPRAVGQSQRSAGAANFLGYFEREARMIFSTLSGGIARGSSEIREASRFRSAILADLETRGLAISFVTLARTAVSISFFRFLLRMHQSWHRNRSQSVPFRTLPKYCARKASTVSSTSASLGRMENFTVRMSGPEQFYRAKCPLVEAIPSDARPYRYAEQWHCGSGSVARSLITPSKQCHGMMVLRDSLLQNFAYDPHDQTDNHYSSDQAVSEHGRLRSIQV
jgi:hypothetical protein